MGSVSSGTVVAVVFVLLVGWAVLKFNEFVRARNRFRNAFAQIDVQLKRRYDLIPNLVRASAAYLAHERATLEAVVRARQQAHAVQSGLQAHAGDAEALAAVDVAEKALAGPLARLLALVEAHPDLRASETVARLVEELASTENRIAFARQAFNDHVMRYNTAIESFPGSLVANPCGFRRADLLRATRSARERQPVVVEL